MVQKIIQEISKVVIGKEKQIKLTLSAFLSESHLLIEDIPGVGKTTLAHAFASILELDFARIQFTSDMMPSDIIGVNIFNTQKSVFEFKKGPIFNSFVLADEINRASAKTQSALLEAMSERTISIDATTYKLDQNFFVIATKNPIEEHGVYTLPQSELDRFALSFSLGYPSKKAQRAILEKKPLNYSELKKFPIKALEKLKFEVSKVHISDEIYDQIEDILEYSRSSNKFEYGISTRGSIDIVNIIKAWALVNERDYVIPLDLEETLVHIVGHRLTLKEGNSDVQEMARLLIQQV